MEKGIKMYCLFNVILTLTCFNHAFDSTLTSCLMLVGFYIETQSYQSGKLDLIPDLDNEDGRQLNDGSI